MTGQPNCEMRVEQHRDSRVADLRLLWRLYQRSIESGDWSHLDREERIELCHEFDVSIFAARSDTVPDEFSDVGEFHEYGLAFDYVAPETFNDQPQGYFRYQISYGGPSEEFRFYVNPDLSCYCVEFWFLDWWDGASRELHDDDKALLMEIWEFFREVGSAQAELDKAAE